MKTLVPVAFNLLVNAAFSFAITLGLVSLALAAIRLRSGRARLALLLLPFVKVLWDASGGIPARSFLWVHALGAKQELGSFQLGLGMKVHRPPFIHAVLNSHYGGLMYSQSAADLLYRGLEQKLSPLLPTLVVLILLGVAATRLVAQLRSIGAFRRDARRLLASASIERRVRVGFRTVCVYVSRAYDGAPYAAGVVHPYVLFSESTLGSLDAPAREAAILHELSHIERHDPLLVTCLALVGSVLWFLPGAGLVTRRVLRELELCADERAVERGAEPGALALALVSVGEQLYTVPNDALGLAPPKNLLRERVERLLTPRGASAHLWYRRLAQLLLVLVFSTSILSSGFFGN